MRIRGTGLNSRYENDDIARFTLVFDGVEDAVTRLGSENVGDLRVALVTADYLTDVLLARRVERVIALSERGYAWEAREQFDSKARGLLRQGFKRRLTLASRRYEAGSTFGLGAPIVDPVDAEVLRVAHAYRNDVYHEDRHPSTIRTIAVAALHAVVRAWQASQSANSASTRGARGPLMDRLLTIGYSSPRFGDDYLCLHDGAATVLRWLEEALPFALKEAQRVLASDIETRVGWADAMVAWLSSGEGPGTEHIEPALHWSDFWRQHGADEELVALDTARRAAREDVLDGTGVAEASGREEVQRRDAAYMARLQQLQQGYVPEISVAALPQLRKRAAGLRQANTVGALLNRYRTLDLEVRVVEEALAEVAIGWDQEVEAQVDRARGKTPMMVWTDEDGQERSAYLW